MINSKQTKREYLQRYGIIKGRVEMLLERKEVYQDDIYGIKSTRLTGMPRGGVSSDIGDKVARCIVATEDIDAELELLCDKLNRIKSVVKTINNYDERSLIEMKYIDGLSYKQLEGITQLSLKTIQRLINSGIYHMTLDREEYDHAMRS